VIFEALMEWLTKHQGLLAWINWLRGLFQSKRKVSSKEKAAIRIGEMYGGKVAKNISYNRPLLEIDKAIDPIVEGNLNL